ncbi:insertion element IS2 transposase InsD [Serratia grimesii]|nr:insertion element IS2 transposase InsD [Serratia grimesii]
MSGHCRQWSHYHWHNCCTADATRTFASSLGFIVCTTPVRSPESNGMAESLVKTFKRDYVYVNDLPDAVSVMEKWHNG